MRFYQEDEASFTIDTFQLFSSDFKNTTVCNTLHQWKYLWKGLLSLLSITYQNNLEKFPFSSIYFHSFCSKPKIHQLIYRLHDANRPHPLAHLDLSLKATWPSASTQSRRGYQAKGSTTCLILPSQSMCLSLLAQLHQLSFERKRDRVCDSDSAHFQSIVPISLLRNKTEASVCYCFPSARQHKNVKSIYNTCLQQNRSF